MKKIELKNSDDLQFLKRNWKTLQESTSAVVDEALDFVMSTVEKDLDMVIERANKTVLGVDKWLKQKHETLHRSYQKKEEKRETDLEVSRMDDEGGAGFMHTLPPHETSPATGEMPRTPDLH